MAEEEIDEFAVDSPAFNLFLLELQELQYGATPNDHTRPWSWFDICTIHGKPFRAPYKPWQEMNQQQARDFHQFPADVPNVNSERGYCSHSSILFTSWHRPCLAMMEQSIYLAAHRIAGTFAATPKADIYREAAERVRLPYWDPFVARVLLEERPGTRNQRVWRCGISQVLCSQKLKVECPDPRRPRVLFTKSIDNPFTVMSSL